MDWIRFVDPSLFAVILSPLSPRTAKGNVQPTTGYSDVKNLLLQKFECISYMYPTVLNLWDGTPCLPSRGGASVQCQGLHTVLDKIAEAETDYKSDYLGGSDFGGQHTPWFQIVERHFLSRVFSAIHRRITEWAVQTARTLSTGEVGSIAPPPAIDDLCIYNLSKDGVVGDPHADSLHKTVKKLLDGSFVVLPDSTVGGSGKKKKAGGGEPAVVH